MQELYNDNQSGYSGNEDCGQMSAWYIFSSMGFYPMNPANGIYYLGSPQLPKAVIHLENGKNFTVIAHDAGGGNIYIRKMLLNGKASNNCYITHSDIMKGSTIEFFMDKIPNKKFGLGLPNN
jgi:putative alpha-1,2-mannosidase